MSVELPPPEYWRCPRFGNDGALFRSRLQAVANGEQVCEALYTADQLRAAVDAALEEAANTERISAAIRKVTNCADITAGELSLMKEIAAAIRAMKT